ncbi:MAG: MBL fold metallo-hydrolase [Deltaproteobacteria bacterium]|nr:MAG: MBL fold metallo-hydrolase [Deltaproteobacteria bacterium]
MPVHSIRGGYANTYLIEDGDSCVAVDVGTAVAANRIAQCFNRRSLDTSRLKLVTATHFHIDHVAGISRLVDLFPEVEVCFFQSVGEYLKRKTKLCLIRPSLWLEAVTVFIALDAHIRNTAAALVSDKFGIPLPVLRTWLPSKYHAACTLCEGQPLPYLPHWELIATPGHTTDSICFYNRQEKTLITGDTILSTSGRCELNSFCCDPTAIRRSFQKLLPLTVANIYPGHGNPLHNIGGLGVIGQ